MTAQHREQNLQDILVAISAVNQRFLKQRNITLIEQLGSIAPNVKIERGSSNSSVAQINNRGATTINPALTWEPTLDLYLDGVYLGKAQVSYGNYEYRQARGTLDLRDFAGFSVMACVDEAPSCPTLTSLPRGALDPQSALKS